MEYLFDSWDKLKKDLDDKAIVLFLDFDGTLAPIADTPEKAVIPPETKAVLRKISENSSFRLAIISGRKLSDIKRMVGIKGVIYCGSHGLEIEGLKIKHTVYISQQYRATLDKIKQAFREKGCGIKGIRLEDKGLILSFHYRLSDKKDAHFIRDLFSEVVSSFVQKNEIKTIAGKMVFEVMPPVNWDKGKAVLWLLARWRFALAGRRVMPIYIGDDITDEDVFKALRKKGMTIFVGQCLSDSSAQYYLRNHEEVGKFLKELQEKNGRFN